MQHLQWFKISALTTALLLFFLPSSTFCSPLPVNDVAVPLFSDDNNYTNLLQATRRSLTYLQSRPTGAVVNLADRQIPVRRLIESLTAFRNLLAADLSDQELQKRIKQNFAIFQAEGTDGFNPDHDMLVTGYFQPVLEGRLVKKAPYLYPLYKVPPDLVIVPAESSKGKKIGRLDNGRFTRYWTRQEIDTLGKAAGNELVWLKDPLDVFFLQVQGSGLIRLGDGTLRGIHFAAKNGHPYHSIGKYMVRTGRMKLKDASMETIRSYMNLHPEEREKILFTNPSYIFFNWAEGFGATGNLGFELTPGRSVAADQSCFPAGGLAFLITRQPVFHSGEIIDWKPVHRFVLVQDTGSAIRGRGRVDLFLGAGDRAGQIAGSMKEKGHLYFLLLQSDKP
jgi:membrane-bound lytic murein transglycosylase A